MALPMRKMGRFLKISGGIVFLTSLLLFVRSFVRNKPVLDIHLNIFDSRFKLGDIKVDPSKGVITFKEPESDDSYLSLSFPQELRQSPDLSCGISDKNTLCMKWPGKGKLLIKEAVYENARCYNIVWTPKHNAFVPMDCISLSNSHWYGGSSHRRQDYPIEQLSVNLQQYISSPLTFARDTGKEVFGPVLERYWFNSKGVGIYVDDAVPLHVSINESKSERLCLKASYIASSYQNPENSPAVLRYFVCKSSNARTVHEYMYKKCFKVPTGMPDENRMKEPMWTSAKFKDKSMQTTVLTYVNEISKHDFPKGFFELYGKYFRGHGDYNFDSKKFPNAHQMIGELLTSHFDVGTWVTPFMDLKSLHVAEGEKNGYFIPGGEYNISAKISWSGNTTYFIDFTNEKAVKWFQEILEGIQKDYRNTAFIFEGGEASFFDLSLTTNTFLHNPCEYTTKYVEFAHSLGPKGTVKVGYQTQTYPLIIEIPERDSSWDYDGGIKSVIPTVLTYGLLGYPFINPGPIGGKGNFSKKAAMNETLQEKILPDSELFIRWMLLSTYLPIMQFSYPPWEYGENVTKLAHELVDHHKTKIYPILISAAKEAQHTGMPIIRPIWWVAPHDEVAQRIDCEFLVGEDMLVAPVLDKGARDRRIYLPSGSRWQDNLRQTHHDGGQWLDNYKVDLMQIATFERLKSPL